jgi:structural maintenance of chromosome 1
LEEKDREFKKLSDIVKEGELEHKVITDECNKVKTTLTQLLRVMNSREMSIAKLRAFRKDTLQQAAVDKVSIPFVSGADSDDDDDDENRMDIETPSQTQGDSSAPSGDAIRVRTGEIDYKKLSRDLKSQQSNAQHESQVKRMQGQMADLGAQLSRMQPNMKAVDQYEDVENRFKATQITLDAARSKAKESEADFEKVKERRSHLFNKAFNHIKKKISNVYKDLTKSKKHTAGGEAYLDVDDPEEPYNGGIRFHTIPPGKQFRDMEQLSGGEKTVAALALLFSIHSYQPSPFFIMDEVDAALDNTNVSKVSNYIRRRSDDFQCIVISLKDQFYGKADSVIGIYRDRNENCSRTLSLDLEPYAL